MEKTCYSADKVARQAAGGYSQAQAATYRSPVGRSHRGSNMDLQVDAHKWTTRDGGPDKDSISTLRAIFIQNHTKMALWKIQSYNRLHICSL